MREASGVSPTGAVTYRRLPFLIRLLQAEVAHFAIGCDGHGDGFICTGRFYINMLDRPPMKELAWMKREERW